MSRKRIKQHEIEQKEKEILTSTVNPTGEGEDPAVKAMLSPDFVNATNKEALQMALAFQNLLKGQASLMQNQDKFMEALERINKRMDEMDRAAAAWERDKIRFIEEVTRRADKLRLSEEAQERLRAEAAQELSRKTAEARAQLVMDKKMFDDALEREPKVTVVSPGVIETVMENGVPVARLYPEELRIKHRRWILYPGRPIDVPRSVAQAIENRRRSQTETAERQKAMAANMESGKLAAKMKEIDERFHSSTAHIGESETI